MAPAPEIYPNITWEVESKKVLICDKFNEGGASMIRSFHDLIIGLRQNIERGDDPLKRIDGIQHWLTLCLYSCNSANFNKETQP